MFQRRTQKRRRSSTKKTTTPSKRKRTATKKPEDDTLVTLPGMDVSDCELGDPKFLHQGKIIDTEEFYESLRLPPDSPMSGDPPGFSESTILFPYQQRAVKWMIDREQTLQEDQVLGGILAEEIGLGKTIEILGLILFNQRYNAHNKNLWPTDGELFDSKSTLIVAPGILLDQWKKEIAKHTQSLKVHLYDGVLKMDAETLKKSNQKDIFKNYDIVLTSYDVLRKEVYFSTENQRTLRNAHKRYLSPLAITRWWRVCLDEVQEVKMSTTLTAKMAVTIPAVYRWAISGTPIKSSFSDIKGTMIFLKCAQMWQSPTQELLSFLKKISCRHSKKHVADEIAIPPPSDNFISVSLTKIERICRRKLLEYFEGKGESAESTHAKNILSKFASSPYFVTFSEIFEKAIDKVTNFNRTKLIQVLVSDATNQLYTAQISLCEALNKLANIHSAAGDVEGAIKFYNLCLDLGQYKKNSDYYEMYAASSTETPLPSDSAGFSSVTYHAAVNLWRLLSTSDPQLANSYRNEADMIRKTFLKQLETVVKRSYKKWEEHEREASNLCQNRLRSPHKDWWIRSLNFIEKYEGDNFIKHLRTGVEQSYSALFVVWSKSVLTLPNLRSIGQLKEKLQQNLKGIYTARKAALDLLNMELNPKDATNGQLAKYEQIFDDTQKAIDFYESTLAVRRVYQEGKESKMTVEVSKTESILLFIEKVIINKFNYYFDLHQKNPRDMRILNLTNQISLMTLEAGAYFRELELLKLEIVSGTKFLEKKRKYLKALQELEEKTVPLTIKDIEAEKAKMLKELERLGENVKEKKEYLELLLEEKSHNVPPEAMYGSKLEKVFLDIKKTLDGNKKAKALVFSAWSEPLVQLSTLLAQEGIKFSSGRAIPGLKNSGSLSIRIDKFRMDPSIRVLLLNALKQSTGLTLTQANNIFLLDPIDEASELQAIGRSYRIGQTKGTHIFRYSINPESLKPIELKRDQTEPVDNHNEKCEMSIDTETSLE